ncbi:MAG: hypothetical protein ACRC8S_20425 [Fimbriiglobus sp.]
MDEMVLAPKFGDEVFRRIRELKESQGADAALTAITDELIRAGDYKSLFYALLVGRRLKLGVTPFPLSPATELPATAHEGYEEAIRETARHVGGLLLAQGDIAKAWPYFRMIGELEPVREAMRGYQPGSEDDVYPLVEIAWQNGLLPQKGFDWILDRSGICSAITMASSSDWQSNPGLRDYCVGRLVRALHAQLHERLSVDVASRGLAAQPTIREMLTSYPDLTAEDGYHIDTSHLFSVVQMAMQLPAGDDVKLAVELAFYGSKLSENYQGDSEPPFEKTYADYELFLRGLVHESDRERAIAYFRSKLPAAAEEGITYPIQVVVNYLVKLDLLPEALAVAKEYLAGQDEATLHCPGILELARRTQDFETLAEHAQAQGDLVTYFATLMAAQG